MRFFIIFTFFFTIPDNNVISKSYKFFCRIFRKTARAFFRNDCTLTPKIINYLNDFNDLSGVQSGVQSGCNRGAAGCNRGAVWVQQKTIAPCLSL